MEKMFALSKVESSVCRLLADGYSTSEIAEARSVSPVTVRGDLGVRIVLQSTSLFHSCDRVNVVV